MSTKNNFTVLIFTLIYLVATTAYAKVTPTDVYASLDMAEQHLDTLMTQRGLKILCQQYSTGFFSIKPKCSRSFFWSLRTSSQCGRNFIVS